MEGAAHDYSVTSHKGLTASKLCPGLEAESHCAQYAAEKRDEEKMCDHLIRAAKYRDHVTSTQLVQKIVHILTDKHGAWGNSCA
ncbi:hypothetical protein NHX12_018066, partial [Muraenolepis orangiensis]